MTSDSPANPDYPNQPWRDADAEPFIRIRGLKKLFGDFAAVDGVDLDIYKGELFSILGGSGSGKTTLLRMLAGFETPSAGSMVIDGVDMNDIPPYESPVNMMVESYALFPHMSVLDNVAYGLMVRKVAKTERHARAEEMLDLVKLAGLGGRRPAEFHWLSPLAVAQRPIPIRPGTQVAGTLRQPRNDSQPVRKCIPVCRHYQRGVRCQRLGIDGRYEYRTRNA